MDDFEAAVIKDNNIRTLSVEDTVDYIKKVDKPLHISFDVDSIDPQFINATGTPV